MDVRETILKRIKDLRKGEVGPPFVFFHQNPVWFSLMYFRILKVPICFGHNVKQEEKLSDFRMDVMEVEIQLQSIDRSYKSQWTRNWTQNLNWKLISSDPAEAGWRRRVLHREFERCRTEARWVQRHHQHRGDNNDDDDDDDDDGAYKRPDRVFSELLGKLAGHIGP